MYSVFPLTRLSFCSKRYLCGVWCVVCVVGGCGGSCVCVTAYMYRCTGHILVLFFFSGTRKVLFHLIICAHIITTIIQKAPHICFDCKCMCLIFFSCILRDKPGASLSKRLDSQHLILSQTTYALPHIFFLVYHKRLTRCFIFFLVVHV